MNVVFIEAPVFSRLFDLYFDDQSFSYLQLHLRKDPTAGAVIRGTGGIRKLRWRDPRASRGKRGGLRIIYYYWDNARQIYLLTVYRKNEAADLSVAERRALKKMIEREKQSRLTDS